MEGAGMGEEEGDHTMEEVEEEQEVEEEGCS